MNTGHFRPMLRIRRVVTQKLLLFKKKEKIRICDDQKQVNWGIPGILNDEINFLQIYRKK